MISFSKHAQVSLRAEPYTGGVGVVLTEGDQCEQTWFDDRAAALRQAEETIRLLKEEDVTVKTFSERNRERCESPNGFNHRLESWSLSDWLTATAGELGEAANIIKKMNRVRDGIPGNAEDSLSLAPLLAEELADVAVYLDLLAQAAGFDLEQIREQKFAKTSKKIGYVEGGVS